MYDTEDFVEEEIVDDLRNEKYREELVESGQMSAEEDGFTQGYYDYDYDEAV